jgi:hypothetical protein
LDLWENTTHGCALLAAGNQDKSLLKPTSNFARGKHKNAKHSFKPLKSNL